VGRGLHDRFGRRCRPCCRGSCLTRRKLARASRRVSLSCSLQLRRWACMSL
jgi:hypothetical protein